MRLGAPCLFKGIGVFKSVETLFYDIRKQTPFPIGRRLNGNQIGAGIRACAQIQSCGGLRDRLGKYGYDVADGHAIEKLARPHIATPSGAVVNEDCFFCEHKCRLNPPHDGTQPINSA